MGPIERRLRERRPEEGCSDLTIEEVQVILDAARSLRNPPWLVLNHVAMREILSEAIEAMEAQGR